MVHVLVTPIIASGASMSGLLIICVPHLAMIGQWFPIIRHLAREALRESLREATVKLHMFVTWKTNMAPENGDSGEKVDTSIK